LFSGFIPSSESLFRPLFGDEVEVDRGELIRGLDESCWWGSWGTSFKVVCERIVVLAGVKYSLFVATELRAISSP
jgi:hypothetical protein